MDPIVDMLNRIRNAQAVEHPTVDIPFSNLKYNIAKILEKQGFVEKVERRGRKTQKLIKINLKYNDKIPAITGLKRVSKLGKRIYLPKERIKKVMAGFGIAIISTSKGLLTDAEARKHKLGGEVLCEIW